MKDIDFDELDRAVSSLMGSVPEEGDKKEDTPPSQAENQNDTPVAPEAKPVAPPQVEEPEPAAMADPAPVASEQPEPTLASPASRGRFMDVKSTGARDSGRPAPSRPVSRQAPVLQPVSSEVVTDQAEQPNDDEPSLESSSQPDLPDPIAFQPEATTGNEAEDTELLASAKDQADSAPGEETRVSGEGLTVDTEPLDSPFLPGTKVEKRPLGRPTESAPVVDLSSELGADSGDSPAVSESPQGTGDNISPNKDAQLPEQPLPAELSNDLLSIETDTGTSDLPAASSAEATPEVSQTQPAAQPVAQPAAATPRPTTPVSIPQQYKVEPKKNEEPQTASTIYDAQPLSHPAKKTPGWVWVLAIIGIIILGVAGGVAVYYFVMS